MLYHDVKICDQSIPFHFWKTRKSLTPFETHTLKDKHFCDIFSYFCDSFVTTPPNLLSTMHWYCIDPRSKLLYFIREGEMRLCIPREPGLIKLIMHEIHGAPFSAHSGFVKAYDDIRKALYRPKMRKDIERYIKTCHLCQVNKPYRQITSAPIQLMPIPDTPWKAISLDLITNLPKSKGYDSILVIVCYLSKMAHFIPTHTTADALQVAEVFIEHVFKLHGLPKIIISDRDPKFTSKFWKSLFKTLETQLALALLSTRRLMDKLSA